MVNNVLPNGHFHKKWHQTMIKTWFNQPARKVRRRQARAAKAEATFPRPVAGALRPVVRGQTIRYREKRRIGRGFTLAELRAAGVAKPVARSLGVAVDARRKNRSAEGFDRNVLRLKEYLAALVVFPKNAKKPTKKDASAKDCAAAQQVAKNGKGLVPVAAEKRTPEYVSVSADMAAFQAYRTLKLEQTNRRWEGRRQKRAAEAAAAEKEKAAGKK